jgi:hypothetical protein
VRALRTEASTNFISNPTLPSLSLRAPADDFDSDPQRRKDLPSFYGYLPDEGNKRTVMYVCVLINSALLLLVRCRGARERSERKQDTAATVPMVADREPIVAPPQLILAADSFWRSLRPRRYVCMLINSALLLLVRCIGAALLVAADKRLFFAYTAGDHLLYLLQKLVRRDFLYWLRVEGVLGLVVSLLVRVVVKTLTDFTGVIQFRAAGEMGGAYWVMNLFLALAASWVAVPLYFGKLKTVEEEIDETTWVLTERDVLELLAWLTAGYLLAFGVFIKCMNREYRCVRRGAASEASARAKRAQKKEFVGGERSEHKGRRLLSRRGSREKGRARPTPRLTPPSFQGHVLQHRDGQRVDPVVLSPGRRRLRPQERRGVQQGQVEEDRAAGEGVGGGGLGLVGEGQAGLVHGALEGARARGLGARGGQGGVAEGQGQRRERHG